jgi:PPOX class probable F420-dependent enzyme
VGTRRVDLQSVDQFGVSLDAVGKNQPRSLGHGMTIRTRAAVRAGDRGCGGSGYPALLSATRQDPVVVDLIQEYPASGRELALDMTATSFDPHALLAETSLGGLATIKSDGRPQLSPVMPFYDQQAAVIYVSMSAGSAKTANLRRDGRATLEVTRRDGWAWATAEGTATLTGPGTDPDGAEVQSLVDYYRLAAGEHPDWDEYRSVMVSDRRVLMTMTVDHVYGAEIG